MSDVATKKAEESLGRILNDASGFDLRELDRRASFLELGFDSLFLIQFTQKIKAQLKVKITFRQLIEEFPTIDALVQFVAANSPALTSLEAPDAATLLEPAVANATSPPVSATPPVLAAPSMPQPFPTAPTETDLEPVSQPLANVQQPLAPLPQLTAISDRSANRAGLEQIIYQQNQLMSMQLALLTGGQFDGQAGALSPAANSPAPAPTAAPVAPAEMPAAVVSGPTAPPAPTSNQVASSPPSTSRERGTAKQPKFERFGPYKPVRKSASGGLTEIQQQSLDQLIERFTKRTHRSREHAQKHRRHFADPRGVAGYRRIWKSIVYQISVDRSAGCKLWDVDGNEYIDIAMGFGLNLFGQSPEFVTAALHQQLDRGVEVGPQSALAGEVAALLCDFARKDRVTFCNTGSEAVMAALRLARTVTGKTKSVFFNRDYHGNFDQVLLRAHQVGSKPSSAPAAPGVPDWYCENTLVLDYGTEEALRIIRENADDIACVLVEPVQSADPFTQPREFLQEVRRITNENHIALIMDEVITGFRAAQGGAQEWFGVWGDMATYGKVLGGRMPIGALAGSAEYMDALDGGYWEYEGDSEPEADMTFFAGTFVRHPLAIAAAYQILMKIKEEGPDLQKRLTSRTTYLAETLNQFFEQELFPIRVAQFTSLFRFMFPPDLEFADLLYFHLLDRGIFTRGWGDNCFLSTEHSDADIQKIIEAVKDSCLEIRRGGFLPRPNDVAETTELATVKKKLIGSP